MSATGNGYVIYMTIKRKTKLKPPELMTVNLAIFDFGISGNFISTIKIIYMLRNNNTKTKQIIRIIEPNCYWIVGIVGIKTGLYEL